MAVGIAIVVRLNAFDRDRAAHTANLASVGHFGVVIVIVLVLALILKGKALQLARDPGRVRIRGDIARYVNAIAVKTFQTRIHAAHELIGIGGGGHSVQHRTARAQHRDAYKQKTDPYCSFFHCFVLLKLNLCQ